MLINSYLVLQILAQVFGQGGYNTGIYSPHARQPNPSQPDSPVSSPNSPIVSALITGSDVSESPVDEPDEVTDWIEEPDTDTETDLTPVTSVGQPPVGPSESSSQGSEPSWLLLGGIIIIISILIASIILVVKRIRRQRSATQAAGWDGWQS